MKTAIITSNSSINHLTGDGHPEQPKRILSITKTLKKRKDLIWKTPEDVPEEILKITHTDEYINLIKKEQIDRKSVV